MNARPRLRTLLALVVLFAAAPAAAQDDGRPIVGVAPFLGARAMAPSTADHLQTMVTSLLFEGDRFHIVEVEGLDAVNEELYEQGDERYMDGVVTAVAPMGAEYLLLGTVAGTDIRADVHDGVRTYSATVTYDLRKVSVGTREVVCQARVGTGVAQKAKSAVREAATGAVSRLFGGRGGRTAAKTLGAETPDAALISAIDDTRPQVEAFLADCFPAVLEVLAVEKEGPEGVEELLVAGTLPADLGAGAPMRVVEEQRFELRDGSVRVREVEVARCTVREMQSGGFVVCAVVDPDDRARLADALAGDAYLVVRPDE